MTGKKKLSGLSQVEVRQMCRPRSDEEDLWRYLYGHLIVAVDFGFDMCEDKIR
ncbi:hypothetical protein Hanom_Chr13g01238171 [Helianthus anomalus]